MEFKEINGSFSICKVPDFSQVNLEEEFCFIGKTDEERSVVCSTANVPENAAAVDGGWRAFRVQGTLDFSMVGILAQISNLLASNQIGIFAVSTYNTDYILVKEENIERALAILREKYV